MKLTNKQENELIQVYNFWLQSYLKGDVKTCDSFLDEGYRFIGTTDNEEFLDKTEIRNFFALNASDLAGKVEIRNSKKFVENFNELYFITDLCDAFFLNENIWEHYGKLRFTSVLKKNKEDWRFVYQ